jgi:hypothetical protein
MNMTTESDTQAAARLSERENQRAVDLIENAERSNPSCPCGAHMLAVAHDDRVWLECAQRNSQKQGLSSILARLTAFSHSRHMIVELPATN